jgi:hypothetical protein
MKKHLEWKDESWEEWIPAVTANAIGDKCHRYEN